MLSNFGALPVGWLISTNFPYKLMPPADIILSPCLGPYTHVLPSPFWIQLKILFFLGRRLFHICWNWGVFTFGSNHVKWKQIQNSLRGWCLDDDRRSTMEIEKRHVDKTDPCGYPQEGNMDWKEHHWEAQRLFSSTRSS